MINIKDRYDAKTTLLKVKAETLRNIDLSGSVIATANLDDKDLGRANLSGCDLRDASLRLACLFYADLSNATAHHASFVGANLHHANFSNCDISCAKFSGSDLTCADFTGAKINWSSHALIAELLLREANDDVQKRMVAGLVAVSTDWCWGSFTGLDIDLKDWALDVLVKYIDQNDPYNCPDELYAHYSDRIGNVPVV